MKLSKLICGKYTGVARVLETGYEHDPDAPPGVYQPNNPRGFMTGQWITIKVVEGIIERANKKHHKGDIIEGIWSHGGDTVIVGKPKVGDMVGLSYGNYAIIFKKLRPNQKIWYEEVG